MDPRAYRRKNRWRRIADRIKHPPPFYYRAGGIDVVVTRADGPVEDLGTVSDVWAKRWGVKAG
jgi:hypothetical protein